MASYLLAWWYGTSTDSEDSESISSSSPSTISEFAGQPSASRTSASQVEPPVAVSISTPEETQEAIDEAKGYTDDIDDVDDTPPAFPSLNSIQRSSESHKPLRTKPATRSDEALMPPPALPTRLAAPSGATDTSISPLYSVQNATTIPSVLRLPTPSTLRIPSGTDRSNTLQLPPSTTRAPPALSKKRGKVALAPGHSPLDWAALKASGQDLRGTPGLMRVTPSQLKMHNTRDDAWSSFNGKVYNITPYLSYHPGGVKELMRVAGRDGTKLFALTHAWVNLDFMLDECMVGFLVPEPSSAA